MMRQLLQVAPALPQDGSQVEIPFLNGGVTYQVLTAGVAGAGAVTTLTYSMAIAPLSYAELRFRAMVARVTIQGLGNPLGMPPAALNAHFQISTANTDGGYPALYEPALGIVRSKVTGGLAQGSLGHGYLQTTLRLEPLVEANRGLACTGTVTIFGAIVVSLQAVVQVVALCERLEDSDVDARRGR